MRALEGAGAYAAAVAAIAAATAARWLLDPALGDHSLFLTYYPAVLVIAWLATFRPAAATLLLGAAAADFFFVPPRYVLAPHWPSTEHQVALALYLSTGSVIIAICHALRAAECRAARQREELQVMLSSIGDGVITADAQGRVSLMNPVAAALTGWSPAEASGRPRPEGFRILNEETRQPPENPVMNALAQRRIVGLANHTVLISKDGAERPIDDSGAPILDPQGKVVGAVLIFRDVSERRLADRTRARLAAIVDSSHDAIVGKSLEGMIISWNRGAEKIFGHTAAEAVGQHISLIVPEPWRAEQEQVLAKIRSGETIDHFETVRQTKDGRSIDVSLTVSPVRDREGGIIGASKIARDVTERRRAADRLRQTAADLSDANRRQREFLALLSHELRNPLAPMRNVLEILRDTGGKDPTAKRALDMMERQFGLMVRLVDDLLDVSRITRGGIALRREPVELAAAMQPAVDAARQYCESRGLELVVDVPTEPLHMNADPARLAQIVGNLLNNACKFTDRGGRIRLSVGRHGSEAVIRIQDTGIGIAADQLARIFGMFAQVDASLERAQGGLGLGLTLVKSLIEAHGGSVEARSAGLGKGSEFAVRLPILDAASRPSLQEPSKFSSVASARRRFLVVDDNRDAAASLALVLQGKGHEVHTAHDGFNAVAAAAKLRPDVVLLDIGMPRLNGYEAARRIRQTDKSAVLVAITGWGQNEDRRLSNEAGIDAHLMKPVGYADLMTVLARAQTESGRG